MDPFIDGIVITRATMSDAEAVLAVIRRAFTPVAEQYADCDMPPLSETLDEHRARYARQVVLKATDASGRILGTVQGELLPDGTCYVGRLAVEPAAQRRGIGRALALAIESEYPEATRFELFTGHMSHETIALYRSLGYRETHRDVQDERLTLVWMVKTR